MTIEERAAAAAELKATGKCIRSVWSRLTAGSITVVSLSAYKPASRPHAVLL